VAAIDLDKAARDALARKLVRQLKDEFDAEIAPMDAQRLLDLLAETLGPYWYNQGLYDAEAILKRRIDDVAEAIMALERPVSARP